MLLKRLSVLALAALFCTLVLSGCAVRSYVAPVATPPSPYFALTASPSAAGAIEVTVVHMNEISAQQQIAAEAAEAEARAAAEAAAAEAAAAAAPSVSDEAYAYDYSYDSASVGDQSADQCVPDLVLNF